MRQYVGARYVPKFSDVNDGEWSSTYSYEALIIVRYGNDYYTSKKPVPVGIEITNDEYWVLSGDYNGAISALNGRVDGVQDELDDAEEDIAKLRNDVDRRYIFIGDSYAELTSVTNAWIGVSCGIIGCTLGTNAYKYTKGGAGFVGNSQGKTFGDLIADAYTDLGDNASLITDIIVCGGCNDSDTSYTTQQINTAKENFYNYVFQHFPNAHIFIGCIGGFQDWTQRNKLEEVRWIYNYQTAKVTPIYNAYIPMLNNGFFSDRVHPNASGLNAIGMVVGTAVLAKSPFGCLNLRYDNIVFDSLASGVSSTDGTIRMRLTANGVELDITHLGVNYSTPITVTYNNGFVLPIGRVNRGSTALTGLFNSTALGGYIQTLPVTVYMNSGYNFKQAQGTLVFVYDDTSGGIDVSIVGKTTPDESTSSSTYSNIRVEMSHCTFAL